MNVTSLSAPGGGVNLTVDTPITSFTGAGVNTNATGLCVWLQNSSNLGMPGKRCGYVDGASAQSASLTGLTFTFDAAVELKSFLVSSLSGTSSGSLQFASGSSLQSFNVSGTVPYAINFNPGFLVAANTPLLLTTTGVVSSATISGEIRINDLQFELAPVGPESVPAPFPLLGAAAAFRASRLLRRRQRCAGQAQSL